MAPPVTPPRTNVRIHGRRGVHSRCCIHRVFFDYDTRRRHNDGPANDDHIGSDRPRLRYNDAGPGSGALVRMSFTLIGWTAAIGS